MTQYRNLLGAVVLLGLLSGAASARAGEKISPPSFQEVYDLLRTNLTGADDATLNRAAVEGLIARLGSRVSLDAVAGTNTGQPALAGSAVFDGAFGYLRVARVGGGLAKETGDALRLLGMTNKLQGLVLDLRFADGLDYAAAGAVADKFFASEQLLLDWGQGTARSTEKADAIKVPVTILVNHQTAGAAEALAAVLRNGEVALLIGTNTAGQASIMKEFVLKNGQRLRVAVASVKLGSGETVPAGGLKADIQVEVSPEDEKQFFADAYKILPKSTAGGVANLSVTNRPPRHRLNEAELVRLARERLDPDDESSLPKVKPAAVEKPVITDPVLARALDLLKGLAVVRARRAE